MPIHGTIEEAGLPDVLQLLSLGRKSGCLSVADGAAQGEIYLDVGRVSFASVADRDRLGEMLVRNGRITREQLDQAVTEQKRGSGRQLGRILLASGSVERAEVEKYVRMQVEEAVYHLFTWKSGAFTFTSDRQPQRGALLVSLDTEGLLLEGARRVDEWSQIERKIPSFDLVYQRTRPRSSGGSDELTEDQRRILPLLDGTRDVNGIAELTAMSEFEIGKALYGLIVAGYARLLERRAQIRHLDYRELLAYVVREAELADPERRKQAARHIVDCPECSERLRTIHVRRTESGISMPAEITSTTPVARPPAAGPVRAAAPAATERAAAAITAPMPATRPRVAPPSVRPRAPDPAPAETEERPAARAASPAPAPVQSAAPSAPAAPADADTLDQDFADVTPSVEDEDEAAAIDRRARERRARDRRAGEDRRQRERRAGLDRRRTVNATWSAHNVERRRVARRELDRGAPLGHDRRSGDLGRRDVAAVAAAGGGRQTEARRVPAAARRGPPAPRPAPVPDESARVAAPPAAAAQAGPPASAAAPATPAATEPPALQRSEGGGRTSELVWLTSPDETLEMVRASRASIRAAEAATAGAESLFGVTPAAPARTSPAPTAPRAAPRPAPEPAVARPSRRASDVPPPSPRARFPVRNVGIAAGMAGILAIGYAVGNLGRGGATPAIDAAPTAAHAESAPTPPAVDPNPAPRPSATAQPAAQPAAREPVAAAPAAPAAAAPVPTGTVRVMVQDANRRPVSGARVAIRGASLAPVMISAGVFEFRDVPEGAGVIMAAADGYVGSTADFRVRPRGTVATRLTLTAVPVVAAAPAPAPAPVSAAPTQPATQTAAATPTPQPAAPVAAPTPAPAAAAAAPAPAPAPAPAAPTVSASEPDRELAAGGWAAVSRGDAAELMGGGFGAIAGLPIESITRSVTGSRPRVRVVQLTPSGERIVLTETRAGAAVRAGPAVVTAIRVMPPSEAYPFSTGTVSLGNILITVKASIPADALRGFLDRLGEVQ